MMKQTKFQQRMRCLLLAAACLLGVVQFAGAQAVKLIDYTTTSWKYHTNDVDPGYIPADAWTAPGFDDSSWPAGFGIFGRESTPAVYTGPSTTFDACQCPFNTFIVQAPGVSSSYFRTHFNWAGNPGAVEFRFTNYVDDSVIVYLNGNILYTFNFRDTTTFPYPWNGFDPSGTANPLGEGVPIVTNVIATGLLQGDNVLAVQLVQQGSGSSDDVFTLNLWATPPTPITITQNPTNRTVSENRTVVMSVGVTGTAPQFQWFKDNVAIPDATNQTYTIASTVVADTGDYKVRVSNPLNTLTSTVGRLTVVVDVSGPILTSVKTDDTFQKIIVTWDEIVSQGSAVEVGNYYIFDSLSNQVSVTSVDFNGSSVVLHVPTLQAGSTYAIEITYQQDLVGNLTPPQGVPTIDPANGVVSNFYTWQLTRGFTRFQAYLNRPAAETLDQFVTLPVYPDGSSFSFYTNTLYWPQTVPNVENYVMRFTGLFVATEDGTYNFDPAHDDSMRLRVFNSEDPSGPFNELAAACCTGLTGGPTLDVSLVAGNKYYYELLVREFGGGDLAGLAVTLPSATVVNPITGQYLVIAGDPGAAPNVGISQQPQSITIAQNHTATFSVTATNVGGGASYQWQISTGGPFSDISGATTSSYTTPLQALTDSGHQYRVLVTVPGRSLTSAVATLTVINDIFPPHITSVRGTRSLDSITVAFDEVMDSGTVGEVSNYELRDSGNNVLSLTAPVISADGRSVSFTCPVQTPGASYTLSAQFLTDLVGNVMDSTNITFQAFSLSRGFILFEVYDGGSGTAVSVLTGLPNYPNAPNLTTYLGAFDSRLVFPTDAREQYGARMSGLFIPPADGEYTFYLRSDDASELWLSTDATTTGLVKVQEETGCCNAFSAHATTSIPMVGGQPYAIQMLYREGGGGDFGQVAVKLTSDPQNPDTLQPIAGSSLAALAESAGASITITQQPVNTTFLIVAGSSTLLDQNLNSNDGGFTVTTPLTMDGPWTYNGGSGSWIYDGQGPENNHVNTSILTTPANTIATLGNVIMTFSHRHSFEGGSWDGGQIRVSKNGGPFVAVPSSSFLQNGYNGSVLGNSSSALAGQPAFVNDSVGHGSDIKITSSCDLGVFSPGDQISIQFFASSDTNTKGTTPVWELDSVLLTQGNGPATTSFTVGFTGTNSSGPNPPRSIQWYRNNGSGFVAIPGATTTTYTIVPVIGDNGAQFRAEVFIPGAGAVSSTATLTVSTGAAQPVMKVTRNPVTGALTITWTGSGTLQHADALLPAGAGFSDVPGNPGSGVVITPSAAKKFYRVR